MLAYCWHESAENTQLRRIARPSPALRSLVDSFIESRTWVDLERIFKADWITGGTPASKHGAAGRIRLGGRRPGRSKDPCPLLCWLVSGGEACTG